MRPLIEECKLLWEVGHPTYDSHKKEMFQMHAMIVGTISIFLHVGCCPATLLGDTRLVLSALAPRGAAIIATR